MTPQPPWSGQRWRRHALLALTVSLCTPLSTSAERLPIRVYTTTDGLAHNTVNRIVKDSRGFLWFCTADGLSRFDGYTFRTFGTEHGLPHPSVTDLLETRAGEYFVATSGGLARLDPRGRPRFVPIAADTPDHREAAQATVLHEGGDGTIWVGTHDGLYRVTPGGGSLVAVDVGIPREYPEQREVAAMLEDTAGTLWIATRSGLYRRWPDGSAARYTERDGLPGQIISDLLEDRRGQLWAATRNAGFFRFTADPARRAPAIDPPVIDGLPTAWVFRLFETSDGRFWVTTARGLVQFVAGDAHGRRLRVHGFRNGIVDYDITAIAEDLGGNIWLGTNNSGALKLARAGFTTYDAMDGIRAVNAVFEDQNGSLCFRGNVFDTTSLELTTAAEPTWNMRLGCFDGERFAWFRPAAIDNLGWVTERVTLQARNGEWWIGTGEGLYRFAQAASLRHLATARPLAVYTVKDGLPGPQVFRLFEDSRGDVWVSTTSVTTHGLARWERATGRLRNLAGAPGLPSLAHDVPRAFGEDRLGNLWIGFNGGLVRYRAGTFSLLTARDGLPPGAIRDIHVDRRGTPWLASAQSGLIRVDGAERDRPGFFSYTTARGMSSNYSEVITEDAAGHVFVGGGRGLDRLDPATGRIRHFTTADGLPPGLFRAAFRDRFGALWFGTSLGLARLAPEPEKAPTAPSVWITGLRIRGEPQLLSALGEQEVRLPDLTAERNQLQVDFVGLSFASGDALRYQYKLEGADGAWSALTDQRTVTYAALASGRYRLVVRAVNSSGIESDRPATLAFTILQPLWRRAWFLGALAVLGVLVVYALFRYRVARLLEIANLRTRIATDLHDDIGANLTRIALLSELARQAPAAAAGRGRPTLRDALEDDREDKRLESIAGIARESVSSMSDIVWAINPKDESLLDLVRRMRQHADELFTLRGIELRFTAPDNADSLKLGPDVRRGVLLIFKEAVSNAARHSRCSLATVDLRHEGRRLRLTVSDNGIGFDPRRATEGQGRLSMQRRAQRLRGTLEILSTHDLGTTVSVVIPL